MNTVSAIFATMLLLISCGGQQDKLEFAVLGKNAIVVGSSENILGKVVIPSRYKGTLVTHINPNAFLGRKMITSVKIPNSVYVIDSSAFSGCEKLEEVRMGENVSSIGGEAFRGCISLTCITIPEMVKSISKGTFQKCTNLKSVHIPDGLENIFNHAFYSANSLSRVKIPASVKTIGSTAFVGTKELQNIDVDEDNLSYRSIDGVLYSKDGALLIFYPRGRTEKEFVVPSTVKRIAGGAFANTKVETVTLPDTLETIGWWAFNACNNMKRIDIPANVFVIETSAFSGCDNLTIYVEAKSKPAGWDAGWNLSNKLIPIVWGE